MNRLGGPNLEAGSEGLTEALAVLTPAMVWQRILHVTLVNEGGNVTAEQAKAIGDPGEATNLGITAVTLKAHGIHMKPKDITPGFAAQFYWVNYWALRHGARDLVRLSPAAALAVFDAGVQHDPRLAIRMFQRAARANADGFVGNQTRGLAEHKGLGNVLVDFHRRRRRLVVRWALRGWVPRRKIIEGLVKRVDRMEQTSLAWLVEDMGHKRMDELF